MSNISIKVENLSKRYRIGLKDEIHDTFAGALTSFIRSPAKNLRRLRSLTSFDEKNSNSDIRNSNSDDIIWALKDVSFEVKTGEVVGIIGRNGAGKSTLLKILSRITHPTIGRVEMLGRISSLLEVGTGFHPELTGRENIYLNGTILGMRKAEIDRKFDEIVSFSGVEKYIYTPVKFYSSGMRVRLAFSVAAHLEPEILLVDEVLAVGDAEFQKKCLGKMDNMAYKGRTILLVSHNLAAIASLSHRAFFLDRGRLFFSGPVQTAINTYLQSFDLSQNSVVNFPYDSSRPSITRVTIVDDEFKPCKSIQMGKPFGIQVAFRSPFPILNPVLGIRINSQEGRTILGITNLMHNNKMLCNACEKGTFRVFFPEPNLNQGTYHLIINLGTISESYARIQNALEFTVNPYDVYGTGKIPTSDQSMIFTQGEWVFYQNDIELWKYD